jgi:hypothetical protein
VLGVVGEVARPSSENAKNQEKHRSIKGPGPIIGYAKVIICAASVAAIEGIAKSGVSGVFRGRARAVSNAACCWSAVGPFVFRRRTGWRRIAT